MHAQIKATLYLRKIPLNSASFARSVNDPIDVTRNVTGHRE